MWMDLQLASKIYLLIFLLQKMRQKGLLYNGPTPNHIFSFQKLFPSRPLLSPVCNSRNFFNQILHTTYAAFPAIQLEIENISTHLHFPPKHVLSTNLNPHLNEYCFLYCSFFFHYINLISVFHFLSISVTNLAVSLEC